MESRRRIESNLQHIQHPVLLSVSGHLFPPLVVSTACALDVRRAGFCSDYVLEETDDRKSNGQIAIM